MKSILDQFIDPPVHLPAKLLARFAESPTCAPYLASCFGSLVLHLSPSFEGITGYACEKFRTEGLKFWFSVIHPADVQGVIQTITKAHAELVRDNSLAAEPLQLEYRIKHKDGKVVWIRELKHIVSYRDGKKDHILGCFRDITTDKEADGLVIQELLTKEKGIHGLLEVAVSYQGGNGKSSVRISAREKDVLRLVAAGYSSKQIAAELSISENTVETHRRHLLEKFKVNNSTALVKEAHRLLLL